MLSPKVAFRQPCDFRSCIAIADSQGGTDPLEALLLPYRGVLMEAFFIEVNGYLHSEALAL